MFAEGLEIGIIFIIQMMKVLSHLSLIEFVYYLLLIRDPPAVYAFDK